MQNFLLEWSHASLGVRGELRNAPKYGVIAGCHANAHAATRNTVCSLQTDVVGFKIVVFGSVDGSVDRFRFT